MGAPGSTPGVEDGDGWQRNKDPPRCRCSLVTKTVMMAPLPPQAGWVNPDTRVSNRYAEV